MDHWSRLLCFLTGALGVILIASVRLLRPRPSPSPRSVFQKPTQPNLYLSLLPDDVFAKVYRPLCDPDQGTASRLTPDTCLRSSITSFALDGQDKAAKVLHLGQPGRRSGLYIVPTSVPPVAVWQAPPLCWPIFPWVSFLPSFLLPHLGLSSTVARVVFIDLYSHATIAEAVPGVCLGQWKDRMVIWTQDCMSPLPALPSVPSSIWLYSARGARIARVADVRFPIRSCSHTTHVKGDWIFVNSELYSLLEAGAPPAVAITPDDEDGTLKWWDVAGGVLVVQFWKAIRAWRLGTGEKLWRVKVEEDEGGIPDLFVAPAFGLLLAVYEHPFMSVPPDLETWALSTGAVVSRLSLPVVLSSCSPTPVSRLSPNNGHFSYVGDGSNALWLVRISPSLAVVSRVNLGDDVSVTWPGDRYLLHGSNNVIDLDSDHQHEARLTALLRSVGITHSADDHTRDGLLIHHSARVLVPSPPQPAVVVPLVLGGAIVPSTRPFPFVGPTDLWRARGFGSHHLPFVIAHDGEVWELCECKL